MSLLKKCFVWHGLPVLNVDKNKIALFTNLDGKLKLIELDKDRLNDNFYRQADSLGLFDCLKRNALSDTNYLTLSLTTSCNCKCRYCFLAAEPFGYDISTSQIFAIIDKTLQKSSGKNLHIAFGGGEATTKFKLIKCAVEYVKNHPQIKDINKVKFSITTNGVFSKEVSDFLIKNNFNVTISMDGAPEIQNFQRPLYNGTNSSTIVERNIFQIRKFLNIKILSTVTAYSVDKMADAIDYFHHLGLKKIVFTPVTQRGRGNTEDKRLLAPSVILFVKNLKQAILKGDKLGVEVLSFPYINIRFSPFNICSGNRWVVNYKGDISSCVEIQDSSHPLFEHFKVGYYNADFNSVNLIEQSKNCFDKRIQNVNCQKCPLLFFCNEQCLAHSYLECNDERGKKEYRCRITKKILPFILQRLYNQVKDSQRREY